jgi:hypothetical protein
MYQILRSITMMEGIVKAILFDPIFSDEAYEQK